MRILLYSEYLSALNTTSRGLHPLAEPSGAAACLHDLLARGLGELGHEVHYLVDVETCLPMPETVRFVNRPVEDVDIWHNLPSETKPWVYTVHSHERYKKIVDDHSIFVSNSLAKSFGRDRYIHNAIDPAEYIFQEIKEDFCFFIASFGRGDDRWWRKGLDLALEACKKQDVQLVVAGTTDNYRIIEFVADMCAAYGAKYVGDVRGREKAELFAAARALFFPTRIEKEGFGLVMIEALMSGTPVICSNTPVCRELINDEVGFICSDVDDYSNALINIGQIQPKDCRDYALKHFHYHSMASSYLAEYEREIEKNASMKRLQI